MKTGLQLLSPKVSMKYWILAPILLAVALPARADNGVIVFCSGTDSGRDICRMNPDGTGLVNLTNTPSVYEDTPFISPDGSEVTYTGGGYVWFMNIDGTGKTSITVGQSPTDPTFRPNSTQITYSRDGNPDYDIFNINRDGTGATKIVGNPYGDYHPCWNPAGNKLVYYSHKLYPTPSEIFSCNADGSGEVRLTNSAGEDRDPAWSPDGTRIVFNSTRTGKEQIYVMDADGSNVVRLTNDAFNDAGAAFSPDGSKIVFQSDRDGNSEIYVMNADGSGQTRLTNNTVYDGSPTWESSDGPKATVSIADTSITEGNSGQKLANLTISLDGPSTEPVTVTYNTADYTAKAGQDYTSVGPRDVVFAPGETSKTISVPVLGDIIDENDEYFRVQISASGAIVTRAQALVYILDDDEQLPVLDIQSVTAPEGTGGTTAFNFTVTVTPGSGKSITVQYTTLDGTAKAGSDYTAKSGTLTIPGGSNGTISIPVIADPYLESGEYFSVKLSNPTNATLGQTLARGTITDDDSKPGISISNVNVAEGGDAVFTVTTTRQVSRAYTVAYATADGTAKAGQDYTATSGILTIPAGATSATITVPTTNDPLAEVPETFTVNLSSPSNGILADGQGVGTITSDDLNGVFVSDVEQFEGNSGVRGLYFTISLAAPATATTKVSYATADGTALAGEDYVAVSGTLTFATGELSKGVVVPVNGDTTPEDDETFTLNLTNPVSATITKAQGEGIITDDDSPLSLSISDVTLAEGNDGTTNAVFTVTLSAISTQPVTVNYATADDTATAGLDYTAKSGSITIPAGQQTATISIPVKGDLASEPDETFQVNLSGAVGAGIADGEGTGTITNDDAAAGFSVHRTAFPLRSTMNGSSRS